MMLLRRALAAPIQLVLAVDDWLHPEPPSVSPASVTITHGRTQVRPKRKRRSG